MTAVEPLLATSVGDRTLAHLAANPAVATAIETAAATEHERASHRDPQLSLRFAPDRDGRTYVASQRATHPYHLCRALYCDADPPGMCTLYSQGCSGGLFEGDRVGASLSLAAGARAHVTTAAATIVHRMPGKDGAEQTVSVDVAAGAVLELMPDPLILFPGSRLKNRLRLKLHTGARALVVESFLMHQLPDDDGPFEIFDAETRVEDIHGLLLARERSVATGAALRAEANESLGAWRGQGSVMVLGAGRTPLRHLRAAIESVPGVYGGASALAGDVGVLARVLAIDGASLRAAMQACWAAARESFGMPAGRPRPK